MLFAVHLRSNSNCAYSFAFAVTGLATAEEAEAHDESKSGEISDFLFMCSLITAEGTTASEFSKSVEQKDGFCVPLSISALTHSKGFSTNSTIFAFHARDLGRKEKSGMDSRDFGAFFSQGKISTNHIPPPEAILLLRMSTQSSAISKNLS